MKRLHRKGVCDALLLVLALCSCASGLEVTNSFSPTAQGARETSPRHSIGLLSIVEEPHEEKHGHDEHKESHHETDDHGHKEHDEAQHEKEAHSHDEHKEEHHSHEEHKEHGHHGEEKEFGAVDHKEVGHEHGHGEKSSHGVAVLLLASVILLPSIFMLVTSEDRLIRLNTLNLIDFFISIFLAVMWFQAFDEFLKIDNFSSTHRFIGAIIHVVILMVVVQVLAYFLREKKISLLVFTTIGAHYLSFAAIHSSEHAQEHYFAGGIAMAFAFGPVVLCILLALMALMYLMRLALKWSDNEKLEEAVEDMEIDVCALTLAFIITQAVRFTLVGKYPGPAGEAHETNHGHGEGGHELFLQRLQHDHVTHTATQRGIMIIYTLVCLTLAAIIPWGAIKHAVHGNKHLVRAVMITHHTMVMLGAWGFMLWGEWEFFETIFVGDHHEIFGRIAFALLCTIIAVAVVLLMALIGEGLCPYHVSSVFALALGLSCAWSWEHAFDVSLDAVAEAYHIVPGHDNDAKVMKGCCALIAPCFMIPPYIKYIKPQVVKELEEAEALEEAESAREDKA